MEELRRIILKAVFNTPLIFRKDEIQKPENKAQKNK